MRGYSDSKGIFPTQETEFHNSWYTDEAGHFYKLMSDLFDLRPHETFYFFTDKMRIFDPDNVIEMIQTFSKERYNNIDDKYTFGDLQRKAIVKLSRKNSKYVEYIWRYNG